MADVPRAVTIGGLGAIWASFKTFLRRVVFGQPLATSVQLEHRLPILLALPVFASDALSSVAYATEEILIQFEQADIAAVALHYLLPISLAIAILVVIVATSYRQAIHLYPTGGGSYSISRDNLGVLPGLVAASALVIDYVLTVAVSISSGVQYLLASFPGIPSRLHVPGLGLSVSMAIVLSLVLVGLITLVNLRGTRESGLAFALPAYSFIAFLAITILATGINFLLGRGPVGNVVHPPAATLAENAGILLVLRAFASGCSALTGVEAVSNGVTAFEPPETKNASLTLFILMVLLVVLFLGVGLSVAHYNVLPLPGNPVISQVAEANFGRNIFANPLAIFYHLFNFSTLLILMIAANTSFVGMPRLMALVAQDGYAPKAFTSLGDRLVYNRGILTLALVAALLLIAFRATTTNLIPLYAVGVFICFTLSQLGMARKTNAVRDRGWRRTVLVNLFGAVVTGVVVFVQAISKFTQGSWMVVVVLPILVLIAYAIHRHYVWFERTMSLHPDDYNPLAEPPEPLTVIVLVSSDIHRGILEGLECGRAIAEGRPNSVLRAVHIEMDPEKTPRLKQKWAQFVEPYLGQKIKLDIVPSPYRWLIEPVMDYLDWADLERTGDRVIIVLPEFETGSIITHFLHNFTARRLRGALLNRPHVTVVSSRYFMRPMAWRLGRGGLVY